MIIPAIYAKYIEEERTSKNLNEFVNAALQTGLFAGSYSLMIKGSSTILQIAGVLQMVNSATNLTLHSQKVIATLQKTEEGKRFLELWPTISVTVDVATLSSFVIAARKVIIDIGRDISLVEQKAIQFQIERAEAIVAKGGEDLFTFINKPLAQKFEDIATAWKSVYPEIFVERQFFEDMMGYYRYSKNAGWGHTADIAQNFKAIDFYKNFTIDGNDIFAEIAVSMKTTTTKSVDSWLGTKAISNNIQSLKDGLSEGITWNNKTIQYNKAELHIYMPKENVTPQLKQEWLNTLKSRYPEINFDIQTLENFIK
jgi:hypothetical protein